MRCGISAGLEPADGVLGSDGLQGCSDGVEQHLLRASFRGSQELFDLRPHLLNWVHVRAIGRQEPYLCASRFHKPDRFGILMGTEIIQHNNVTGPESRKKDVPYVFTEDVGIGCPVDSHAGRRTVQPNRRDHRRGAPMTMRGVIDYTLALLGPASQTRHVRFCPRFIEKNEPSRVERRLLSPPFLAVFFHVGPVLLTRS